MNDPKAEHELKKLRQEIRELSKSKPKPTLTKDEFFNDAAGLVEKHFPKGMCGERGQAMVLLADTIVYLDQKGVLNQ